MNTELATPKRLTLSTIVEMLLNRGPAQRSYVTLTRNAKGDTQIEVTIRVGDDDGLETPDDAASLAASIYARMRDLYPHETGSTAGSSVAVTRNAKGDTQIAVEVKTTDGPPGARTLEEAEAEARSTYERLTRRYPMANGTTRRTPAGAADDEATS